MSRSRKLLVVFAIVGSLLAITFAPATVAQTGNQSAVGSQHTDFGTDEEPSPNTLNNLTINGSGISASVAYINDATLGTTARPADEGSTSSSYKHGLKVRPEDNLSAISINISDKTSGATTAYLYTSDDTQLAQSSITDGTATLEHSLQPSNSYYVFVDAGGSSFNYGYHDDTSRGTDTYTGDDITIVTGASRQSNTIYDLSSVYAIKDITAIGVPDNGSYVSANHSVSNASAITADVELTNAEATIEAQYWDGGQWTVANSSTVSTTGNHSVLVPDVPSTRWRTKVTFEKTGSDHFAELHDESVLFENDAPAVSNASPDEDFIDSSSVDLQVDVSDTQFGSAQGESVDVTFYDGEDDSVIGTDTISSNGAASATWSTFEMGTNQWYAVAEDDYGATTQTDTLSFETPHELLIYNESNPSQLVNDSVNVEVTFFGSSGTYTRTTSNGKIDLSGLPFGEEMTVQVEASGYITRQTIIRSITEQQEVFILPESAETVSTRFQLNDPTGQFDPSNSRILIKKPIERNGTTTYKTVVGDVFGTGDFSTTLERDQRYLIEVENTRTGEIRELGPYVATTSENVVLEVDQLDFQFEEKEAGYRWNATYVNASGSPAIDFAFDADHGYEEVNVKITERGSGEVIYTETWSDGNTIQDRFVIPDSVENANETTYSVEWSATVYDSAGNTANVDGSTVVGPNTDVPIEGVGDRVLQLVSIFLVLVIAGLFSAANVGIGGVVTSLSAGLLWMIGVLPGAVSGIMIVIALMISVLWMVRNARGPQ